jgi:hypothetical protein
MHFPDFSLLFFACHNTQHNHIPHTTYHTPPLVCLFVALVTVRVVHHMAASENVDRLVNDALSSDSAVHWIVSGSPSSLVVLGLLLVIALVLVAFTCMWCSTLIATALVAMLRVSSCTMVVVQSYEASPAARANVIVPFWWAFVIPARLLSLLVYVIVIIVKPCARVQSIGD